MPAAQHPVPGRLSTTAPDTAQDNRLETECRYQQPVCGSATFRPRHQRQDAQQHLPDHEAPSEHATPGTPYTARSHRRPAANEGDCPLRGRGIKPKNLQYRLGLTGPVPTPVYLTEHPCLFEQGKQWREPGVVQTDKPSRRMPIVCHASDATTRHRAGQARTVSMPSRTAEIAVSIPPHGRAAGLSQQGKQDAAWSAPPDGSLHPNRDYRHRAHVESLAMCEVATLAGPRPERPCGVWAG